MGAGGRKSMGIYLVFETTTETLASPFRNLRPDLSSSIEVGEVVLDDFWSVCSIQVSYTCI